MGETAAKRALLAHRAAVMHEWKGQDSYTLHQMLLQEMHDLELERLLSGPAAEFEFRRGILTAVKTIRDLADRSIREHQRQVEAA